MASEPTRHEHRWVEWPMMAALFTCEEPGCGLTGTRATLARLEALEEMAAKVAMCDPSYRPPDTLVWTCAICYAAAPTHWAPIEHAPGCPVTVARELMRGQGETG